jgi:hypothetical protein
MQEKCFLDDLEMQGNIDKCTVEKIFKAKLGKKAE